MGTDKSKCKHEFKGMPDLHENNMVLQNKGSDTVALVYLVAIGISGDHAPE